MRDSLITLIQVIHIYDGKDSLKDFLSTAWSRSSNTYQRLLSHADSLGMNVEIVPEDSKLKLNIIIKV